MEKKKALAYSKEDPETKVIQIGSEKSLLFMMGAEDGVQKLKISSPTTK